jgi:Cd2+/Zn2+-exporting ATPase
VAQAARNGVLVKGSAALENLGQLKAIAFDKTGTLTYGRPEVTDVVAFHGEKSDVLALAAGSESRSSHPLARAVVRFAQAQDVTATVMNSVESLTGSGLRATFDNKTIRIGNQALMNVAGVALPPGALDRADTLQQAGKTLIWVAVDQIAVGLIALADTMRPEAAPTMKALREIGVAHTIMLTGDNPRAAAAIAAEVGLTDFRADLMPDEKMAIVRSLVQEYRQVGMIGDGVNDAPALANATVGIAMGGAGTDVALETADVALMGDNLSRLPFAVGLGRATRATILQNLGIAGGVISLLVLGALTGILGIGLTVVVHEGSTIVVALNALRLLNYKSI